jgi:hypothetical protein
VKGIENEYKSLFSTDLKVLITNSLQENLFNIKFNLILEKQKKNTEYLFSFSEMNEKYLIKQKLFG